MFRYALVALCLIAAIQADDIQVTNCGDASKGELIRVYMDGCSASPCEVHRGETAHGGFVFQAAASTNTLTCEIFGIIFGETLPFPGGCNNVDGCLDIIDGNCPIDVGEEFEYEVTMPILDSYPTAE